MNTNYTGLSTLWDNGQHVYLSTACMHAQQEGREDLHEYCRCRTNMEGEPKVPATCKWCAAPCVCWCHVSRLDT